MNSIIAFVSFFNLLPYLFLETIAFVSKLACFCDVSRVALQSQSFFECRKLG